jgi:hypothetical protein
MASGRDVKKFNLNRLAHDNIDTSAQYFSDISHDNCHSRDALKKYHFLQYKQQRAYIAITNLPEWLKDIIQILLSLVPGKQHRCVLYQVQALSF